MSEVLDRSKLENTVDYQPRCERALCGALVLYPEEVLPLLDDLEPGDCFDVGCQSVFTAVLAVYESGKSIGVETVFPAMLKDQRLWTGQRKVTQNCAVWLLADCLESCKPSDAQNVGSLIAVVKGLSLLRKEAHE